jgi:hypothetical protein
MNGDLGSCSRLSRRSARVPQDRVRAGCALFDPTDMQVVDQNSTPAKIMVAFRCPFCQGGQLLVL